MASMDADSKCRRASSRLKCGYSSSSLRMTSSWAHANCAKRRLPGRSGRCAMAVRTETTRRRSSSSFEERCAAWKWPQMKSTAASDGWSMSSAYLFKGTPRPRGCVAGSHGSGTYSCSCTGPCGPHRRAGAAGDACSPAVIPQIVDEHLEGWEVGGVRMGVDELVHSS